MSEHSLSVNKKKIVIYLVVKSTVHKVHVVQLYDLVHLLCLCDLDLDHFFITLNQNI